MAITKPTVLPSWAESGDKVQPSNPELQVGWPLSSVPPSRQRFNWLLNYLSNAVRYFSRRGISDYDAAEIYMIGDRIIGDDGKTYRSLIDTNTANTPSASPTKWEEWAPTLSRFADLIQRQVYTAFTTAGAAPNFTLTPSPAIAAYTAGVRFRVKFHAAGAGADQLNISGLGNKALKQYDDAGVKVAATIAAGQLTDVEYDGVDLLVLDPVATLAAAFGGANQSRVANGYQKLPGGVIIQWGTADAVNPQQTITFPIAFPTLCALAVSSDAENSSAAVKSIGVVATTTQLTLTANASPGGTVYWFAIGY
ncbi:MAG: gp53-like domain-containing protein [Thiobacillus sp.]